VRDFVLGFGVILILLFLVPATIVVARTWMESSRALTRVARARAALIWLVLGYFALRQALSDGWGGTLRVLARQFVMATMATVPAVIIAGLVLALLAAPQHRRGVRLLLSGPLGIGPITCVFGIALIGLYCISAADRIHATRAGIAAAMEGLVGQVAGGLVGVVLMLVPAVAIFAGAALSAIANVFNTGAAHPLLPALVGPWFLAALVLAAGPPAALIPLVVAVPAALALSVAEILLVRRELRVGFRDAPPRFTVEYGKGWLIRGPRGIWQPPVPAEPLAVSATPPVSPIATDQY
jgi:hypothetical protein